MNFGALSAIPAHAPRLDDALGKPISLVIVFALLSLVPFVFMGVTAFVKISTVIHIVRSAIGADGVPSNTVVMALSTALTLIAMAPVGERMFDRVSPLLHDRAAMDDATALIEKGVEAVREPMREFLQKNSSAKEKDRFFNVSTRARAQPSTGTLAPPAPNDLSVLVPAFVVTSLTEAFTIGFLLFLPFLIIDVVVGNVLLALGMQALNPTQVSLPFKLLLFVAIDGWGILAEALISGYR